MVWQVCHSYPLATKPKQYIFLDTLTDTQFLVSQADTFDQAPYKIIL